MKNIKYTKGDIISGIKSLGITDGDTVLVRADLSKIGKTDSKIKTIILDAFFEIIGESGTLISLSFTKQFPIFKIDKNYVFDSTIKSESGAFPNIMLKNKNSFRSSHPISSFVAIGKNAEYFIEGHDGTSLSYAPMKKLIELNGKMVLIGCTKNSPGFTTVHYAQEMLGLTKKNFLSNFIGVNYKNKSETELFKRQDIGGCSSGFHKFYSYYIQDEKLRISKIGNAYSLSINAMDAYEIEYKILKKNPRFILCDNPDCLLCNATLKYNKRAILPYIFRILFLKIKGIFESN